MRIGETYAWRGIEMIVGWVRGSDICLLPAREEYRMLALLTARKAAEDG